MAESDAAQDRQVRRSSRVSRRLARVRARNNRQLAQIREREELVDRALRDYVAAAEQVAAVDQACEDRVSVLEAKLREAMAERQAKVADVRDQQARAVLAIHRAGRTVKQVADLLELSEKATRQLLKCGREAAGEPQQVAAPAPAGSAGAGTADYLVRTPE